MIQARHRRDYDGEFVIVDTVVSGGCTSQTREWIANPIDNFSTSGRAAVIGSRALQAKFRHSRLQRHRGGLLGQRRLQTYGAQDLWQDMTFDFFVTTDRDNIQAMAAQAYDQRCTVYTTARLCLENPGRFYLIPYLPQLDALAMPVYLAAFDGHAEVFMLGYCRDTATVSRTWAKDLDAVFAAYPGTQFILVGQESSMLPSWLSHSNVQCIGVRRFVSYCDI